VPLSFKSGGDLPSIVASIVGLSARARAIFLFASERAMPHVEHDDGGYGMKHDLRVPTQAEYSH
jgi:hypothetical protein